jgi:hypothetical protein
VTFVVPAQSTSVAIRAVAGDLNDDGVSDLVFLNPNATANSAAGAAYVIFGVGP